jgi:shikimate kinase/3-dehydroquinate synthase
VYLFLVGPPGVGKSTVAPLLAKQLAADVLAMDDAIEQRTGQSNKDTIEKAGIERFRGLESVILAELPQTPAWTVVDTGGGTPIREANRRRMRELGLIVGLRGSVERITSGIAATMAKRPEQSLAPADRARHALTDPERVAGYADVDVSFDVEQSTPGRIAISIATWLHMVRGVRVDVGSGRPYPVLIRSNAADHIGPYVRALGWKGRIAVINERTVMRHGTRVLRSLERSGYEARAIRVPAGEAAKSLDAVGALWRDLAEAGIGRDGGIVAVGGGALGDAAGFAAATYVRGVPFVQVPTTLLAMVDASIGGKTAIDIDAGKNLVGAFHQPDAVFADIGVLATLPRRQRASGLAEIVKTAVLVDGASVAHVDRAIPGLMNRVTGVAGVTLTSVTLAAEVKASVVTADPLERGVRVLLNFGHTMGHALEAGGRYRLLHGEAVALGMVYATVLSEVLGLAEDDLRFTLERILTSAGLPTRVRIPARAWALLGRDKKAQGGKVRWILPRRVGKFAFVNDVPDRALRQAARILEGR